MESFFRAVYKFLTDFKSFEVTNSLCNLQSDSPSPSFPLSCSSALPSSLLHLKLLVLTSFDQHRTDRAPPNTRAPLHNSWGLVRAANSESIQFNSIQFNSMRVRIVLALPQEVYPQPLIRQLLRLVCIRTPNGAPVYTLQYRCSINIQPVIELNMLPVLNPKSNDGAGYWRPRAVPLQPESHSAQHVYRFISSLFFFFFFFHINYACPPLRYDAPMARRPSSCGQAQREADLTTKFLHACRGSRLL